uniref:Uncharacterized protein n=1 Tax=Rhizophora mucronata TaxID=61149 RepID=A0A2P2PWN8_RHIMU
MVFWSLKPATPPQRKSHTGCLEKKKEKSSQIIF